MSDMEDENPRNNRGAKWQKEWGRLRSFLGGSTRLTRRQSQWQKGDGFTMVDLDLEGKPLQTSEIDGERQQDAETDCFGKNCQIFKVAASGRLSEFRQLCQNDVTRLQSRDRAGATPLHHAAGNDNLSIMEYILKLNNGGWGVICKPGDKQPTVVDVNAQDHHGRTPLHWAVREGHPQAVELLLQKGADAEIKDEEQAAPIHTAVETGQVECLKALLHHPDRVNVNLPGHGGAIPLHYAAWADRKQCMKLLIENGALPCLRCDRGSTSIHMAAMKACSGTLEYLMELAEEKGYKREMLLSFKNKQDQMPLHAAVNGGNKEAVVRLIRIGARIDAKQDDESTPMHLASSQGALDIIKLMMESADKNRQTIHLRDVQQMTPLHKAAMFDHTGTVEYLLEEGADLNCTDSEERSPLLLAASRGAWKTVKVLLSRGADANLRDLNSRNFLHLAILGGGGVATFHGELGTGSLRDLLDEKDEFGCTPLHYASEQGHLKSIELLLQQGASAKVKNNEKQSALHFAAKYGRLNTVRSLLNSPQGPNIINDPDGLGDTALHMASANGHTAVVKFLLQKGAFIHKCQGGRTALHRAAIGGHTQTMRVLLSTHAHLLNQTDKEGNTALHLAAMESKPATVLFLMTEEAEFKLNNNKKTFFEEAIELKNRDVAMAIVGHDRWIEAMTTFSRCDDFPPIYKLIDVLPDICMYVLDKCRTTASCDEKSQEFWIKYDYEFLQCPLDWRYKMIKEGIAEVPPLAVLNKMVDANRVELLSHPVCINFLDMKWNAYGRFVYLSNLFIYAIFLIFLTIFVATAAHPTSHNDFVAGSNTSSANETSVNGSSVNDSSVNGSGIHALHNMCQFKERHWLENICIVICLAFGAFNVLKEIAQMMHQKQKYFRDVTNLLEWCLYIATLVFIIPFLTDACEREDIVRLQWQMGAVAVFLAWFNLMLYLQRFDIFGIFIVMYIEILKTLLQVLMVFSFLVIAFGLAFYILGLSADTLAHSTAGLSFFQTGMMILEGPDAVDNVIVPYVQKTLLYPELTIVFIVAFVLLMPILLMNLLIGLAVGDISGVQRNAQLKRLAMQVELHTELEAKLPEWLVKRVDKVEVTVYPNRNCKGKLANWLTQIRASMGIDDGNSVDHDAARGDALNSTVTTRCLAVAIDKQKRRMKEMNSMLVQQGQLLRLIVQKMEIRTEADDRDVGDAAPMCRSGSARPATAPRSSSKNSLSRA
ncbi:TRPA1 [Branchiostoma lanceolatum]|uniref:TRPA1 protein n=1 Tax=Branchiostoma lanceolatum TaxID=7740 RepID=A0A8J9ZIK9_BRALA|nr:TRPA1 [Branchiostoma lanceolatum]